MNKENKDIGSIFVKIRKNIDGEFLYSEKWTTDDFDFEYNSLESNDPKDFVELHDLLIGLSPSLSFSNYLQINEMIKLEKKRVGDDDSRWTVNRWRINLNDLLSFLEIKGYIKKKDFSYLLEDKFRKVIYKDIDEIINDLPNEIKEKIAKICRKKDLDYFLKNISKFEKHYKNELLTQIAHFGNDDYLDTHKLIESNDYCVYYELFRHGRIKDLNEIKQHHQVSYLFDFDSVPFPW